MFRYIESEKAGGVGKSGSRYTAQTPETVFGVTPTEYKPAIPPQNAYGTNQLVNIKAVLLIMFEIKISVNRLRGDRQKR